MENNISYKDQQQIQKENIAESDFFDINTLRSGALKIIDNISNNYNNLRRGTVIPIVQPGFMRKLVAKSAPQQGRPIEEIITDLQTNVLPTAMLFQHPRCFSHFSHANSVASIIGEIFQAAYISIPALYLFSPSFTQLQNIVVDWISQMTGLPTKYTFKQTGGGIINPSATQSLFTIVHSAKIRKMNNLKISTSDSRICKLVGYYSDFCHVSIQKAFHLKDIPYQRKIPSFYNQSTCNFEIHPQILQEMIKKDIQDGLIPFMFSAAYGSTLTCAIDLNEQIARIVKKYDMWLNVDAAYLGTTFIIQEKRPKCGILQYTDSIIINFSKNLLAGNGGSLLFVADRKEFSRSISKKAEVCYLVNQYTQYKQVVDYMDWTVGMDKRLNVLKFYLMFLHYGVAKIKGLVEQIHQRANVFRKWIDDSEIFQAFTHIYGLITFRVKDPITNKPSNQLSKKIAFKVQNTQAGSCTPGQLNQYNFIRINVSSIFTKIKHLRAKFDQIQKVAIEVRNERIFEMQNKS